VIEADTWDLQRSKGGVRGFPQRVLARPRRETRIPEEFVRAMTESGYLRGPHPRHGGGWPGARGPQSSWEEINRSGGNAQPPTRRPYTRGNAPPGNTARGRRAICWGSRAVRFGFKPSA